MNYREEFIELLVKSGALTFGEFTTKSGRRSPYFINIGSFESIEDLMALGRFYARRIKEGMDAGLIDRDVNVIFGPAYKGISLAISAGMALYKDYGIELKYCFNRKEAKDHGEGGSFVGHQPQAGDKVILIDDVITAGTAIREALPLPGGAVASALVISVDRMERGKKYRAVKEIERDFGINVLPITDIRSVVDYLHKHPVDGRIYIDDNMRERLEVYFDEWIQPDTI